MVKDHVVKSLELFNSGFNCSQAVLASFSEDFGLARETALKVACPFGGGMGGYGKTCGALTGGMIVIGLKYGTTKALDLDAEKISRDKTRELIDVFEREHGTSICNKLVGFDRSKMSNVELMSNIHHFNSICPGLIETVVSFLEEEL